MKCPELLSGILLSLLIFGPPLVVGYIIGRQDGKLSERKAILERWEEIKELRRQDSIKQQINNKAMKQKIQITGKNIGKIFALPCVKEIRKYNFLDTTFVVHLWNAAIRHGTIFADCAFPGDWLVQDDNGIWYVEEGDKK